MDRSRFAVYLLLAVDLGTELRTAIDLAVLYDVRSHQHRELEVDLDIFNLRLGNSQDHVAVLLQFQAAIPHLIEDLLVEV